MSDVEDQLIDEDGADGGAFKVWGDSSPKIPNCLSTQSVTLHDAKVYARASLMTFGSTETGEIRSGNLVLEKWDKAVGSFLSTNRKEHFTIRGDALIRLQKLLQDELPEAGRFVLVDTEEEAGTLIQTLRAGNVDTGALIQALGNLIDRDDLVEALKAIESGLAAAELAVIQSRREQVDRLDAIARNPQTTETRMQKELEDKPWLFGGHFVSVATRRKLTLNDSFDIPLVTATGALHVVELKGPNIPDLIKKHRSHWIPGAPAHEAIAQTMNYLRSVDEQGLTVSRSMASDGDEVPDLRRVFATVVLGHTAHLKSDNLPYLRSTLRTYNSHLSRIELITYDELFAAARNALQFEK